MVRGRDYLASSYVRTERRVSFWLRPVPRRRKWQQRLRRYMAFRWYTLYRNGTVSVYKQGVRATGPENSSQARAAARESWAVCQKSRGGECVKVLRPTEYGRYSMRYGGGQGVCGRASGRATANIRQSHYAEI